MSQASQAGAREVSDARLALMTRREDVKQVAQMMHQDHSDANQRLVSLLKVKGWPAPAPVDLAPGPRRMAATRTRSTSATRSPPTSRPSPCSSRRSARARTATCAPSRATANLRHHLVALQALGSA
ncbi:MAG: DUF4142 domain-containing protein [Steroidobacteraceae bacterium]